MKVILIYFISNRIITPSVTTYWRHAR